MTRPKWQTAERHGEKWHEHGPIWEHARRLYLAYPFIPVADLARVLGVSRARFNVCVEGLRDERDQRCDDALKSLKRKEGL
jgi:hypothetical protein